MVRNVAILLLYQLAGESVARLFGLSVPGPVIGLAALFATFLVHPPLAARMRDTANGLLGHLSLLFVPAGVGVIAHLATLGSDGPALAVALVASTALAILAGVGAFLAVARIGGTAADD